MLPALVALREATKWTLDKPDVGGYAQVANPQASLDARQLEDNGSSSPGRGDTGW